MPRTTGIIVIGAAALVVGYLVIGHFMGSKQQQGQGGNPPSGGTGGSAGYGPGGRGFVRGIRDWQGHRPRHINPRGHGWQGGLG